MGKYIPRWTTFDADWNVTGCWLDEFNWPDEMRKLPGEYDVPTQFPRGSRDRLG